MKPVSTTRRDFLKKSALGAGVKSASATKVVRHKAPTLAPELGASDRIVAGFIGVGGQGYNSHPIRGGGHGGDAGDVEVVRPLAPRPPHRMEA